MKRFIPLLLLAAACGDSRTTLFVTISGPAVESLKLTVTLDLKEGERKKTQQLLSANGSASMALPASVLVVLPDEAAPINVGVTGIDADNRTVEDNQGTQSVPHHQVALALALIADGNDLATPPDLLGADLTGQPSGDLAGADLSAIGSDAAMGDGGGVMSLQILAGLPGDNGTSHDGVGLDGRIVTPQEPVLIGTSLYFFEYWTSNLRKVDVASGVMSTVPLIDDSNSTAFYHPGTAGLVYDSAASTFYCSNYQEHVIYRFALSDARVHVLAGAANSSGSTDSPPRFNQPVGLALDGHGNLWVADSGNATLREIVLATAAVSTPAGTPATMAYANGTGAAAHFMSPNGLAFDSSGDLYITDGTSLRKAVVAASPAPAVVSTVVPAGSWVDSPVGVATAAGGVVYVLDAQRNNLQRVTGGGAPVLVAGHDQYDGISSDGVGTAAYFTVPRWLVLDGAGAAYVTESGAVRKIKLADFTVTTLAGLSPHSGDNDSPPAGANDLPPARFTNPAGLVFDGTDTLFVGDASNNLIRTVSISSGVTATLAGDGSYNSHDGNGKAASFGEPTGLARDAAGNLYVTDYGTHTVRRVAPNGDVLTLAGVNGSPGAPSPSPVPGLSAHLNNPDSIAFDGAHTLFFSDAANNVVRAIDLSTNQFVVSTIAGSGATGTDNGIGIAATLNDPHGLAWDAAAKMLYVTDYGADLIRTIDMTNPNAPVVGKLAGTAYASSAVDGSFAAATFKSPLGLGLDSTHGILWVADNGNQVVRRLDLVHRTTTTPIGTAGIATTKAGPLPSFINQPWAVLPTPQGLVITSWAENTILFAPGLQ